MIEHGEMTCSALLSLGSLAQAFCNQEGRTDVAAKAREAFDRRVAKMLGHPLRAQALAILDQRVASPSEIAKELGEALGVVSYHIKVLREYECVELVRTEQRRGALEHYYRAIMRPFFTDEDWKTLPQAVRQGISSTVIQMIVADAAESLEEGCFDERDDRHLSRTPLVLDEDGWSELRGILEETLARTLDLQARVVDRMAREGTEGITSKLAILHFESPAREQR